ncbi:integrin beta-7 isoform X2 [Cuculus canorus]|uniref:integrin beta-7 isoform X2 n=1 Tax=Cuculus canorus TaxID=55661 RepID=UPI0023AAE04B|nr:integrin beta-7 isoform X2 [Cuculus canorus]
MAGLGGLLLLLLLMARGGHGEDYCDPHESCEECVSAHPQCAWCEETHPPEPLQPHGRGSDPDGTQQLRPSRVQLRLRPREEQSFQVRFRRAQDRPVDIYYLMDLSYSMRDDLENVRKLGSDLLAALRNVTTSVRIGFGSFVDKPVLPFVSTVPSRLRNPCPEQPEPCAPPTAFHHVLSLTDDAEEFAKSVSRQRVSGNLDAAEGGFEAIMQVAVCQERIGWRRATRLLVFASDDVFHSSGDGKLGGIVLPSDSRCHLDAGGRYTKSHIYDYPSVGHLAEVLSAANIHPIFAVTAPTVPTYRELSRLIPKSVVGELRDDSSNVVQLIADAYDSLSSTVELRHSPLPPDVTLTYESHCGDPPDPPSALGGRCTRVAIDQEVRFTVRVRADACLSSGARVGLRVLGVPEELSLELSPRCGCPCAQRRPRTPLCHGGDLDCGVCRCPSGRGGLRCELEVSAGGRSLGYSAPPNSSRPPCGSCQRHRGLICGGPQRGECICGICRCHGGYRGPHCGHCPSCRPPCHRLRPCAECVALGRGALPESCSRGCPPNTTRAPAPPTDPREWCRGRSHDGRELLFLIQGGEEDEGGVTLTVWAEEGGALGGPWTVAVLVAAPVVFGVLVLGLCRLSLQLHARRDFRRFQQRRHHHCQPPVPARLRGPHRDPPKISGVPPGTPTQSLGTPKTPPQGCGPPISLWTPIIPGDPPPPITGDP